MPEIFILSRICPRCGGSEFKRIMDASLGSPTSFRCNYCGAEVDFVYSDPSLNDVTPKSLWDRAWSLLNYQQWTDAENTFSEVLKRAPFYTRALWGMCLAKKHCLDTRAAHGTRAISQMIALFNNGDFSTVINAPDDEVVTKSIIDYFGTELVMAQDIIKKNNLLVEREYFGKIFREIGQEILDTYTKEKYEYAIALQSTNDLEQLRTALKRLSEIQWYKDTKERIVALQERTNSLMYNDCVYRFEATADNAAYWQELANDFDILGDYKQARHYSNNCRKMSSKLRLIRVGCIICSIVAIIAILAFVIVFVFFRTEDLEYQFSMLASKFFSAWGDPDDYWLWQQAVLYMIPLWVMSVFFGVFAPFCSVDSSDGLRLFIGGIIACSVAFTVFMLREPSVGSSWNNFVIILLSPLICALFAIISAVPGGLVFFLSKAVAEKAKRIIKLL